jgi:3-phenylpropionate/trans-cinnamate dioxygenase ferredoxin component
MNFENDNGYTKICSINDLKEQEGKRFFVEDNEIAIFKIQGEVFVLNNHCPHQHTAQIFEGFIEEGCVVCPSHGWKFNLRTGKTLTGGNGLISYETLIIDNYVYAKLTRKEYKW